jgi:hypothetical protein
VSRATTIGSTLGSSFLSRQCTARIAARSVSVERLLPVGCRCDYLRTCCVFRYEH